MHVPVLMETLVHDFRLNGTCYDKALMEFLQRWNFDESLTLALDKGGSLLCSTFKTIGLSAINAGENAYIHTALRLINSLISWPSAFWFDPTHRLNDVLHSELRWSVSGNHRQLSEFVRRMEKDPSGSLELCNKIGLRWLHSADSQLICKLIRKPNRNNINSGRIYRIQRGIRLRKLQTIIRDSCWEANRACRRNRDLVLNFLIPVLDQCPKSDELLALINQQIRHVVLQYTPRRHLRDAVYRYIRRTSDAGSN